MSYYLYPKHNWTASVVNKSIGNRVLGTWLHQWGEDSGVSFFPIRTGWVNEPPGSQIIVMAGPNFSDTRTVVLRMPLYDWIVPFWYGSHLAKNQIIDEVLSRVFGSPDPETAITIESMGGGNLDFRMGDAL